MRNSSNTWLHRPVSRVQHEQRNSLKSLNKEVSVSIADPKFEARLANLAGMVLAGSPADFRKLIADETNKWGKAANLNQVAALRDSDRAYVGLGSKAAP